MKKKTAKKTAKKSQPRNDKADHYVAVLSRIIKTSRNLTGVQTKTLADLIADLKQ